MSHKLIIVPPSGDFFMNQKLILIEQDVLFRTRWFLTAVETRLNRRTEINMSIDLYFDFIFDAEFMDKSLLDGAIINF